VPANYTIDDSSALRFEQNNLNWLLIHLTPACFHELAKYRKILVGNLALLCIAAKVLDF
jgi:hypothetical protein